MPLSKSKSEYLANSGWSSSKFFEQAKALFNDQDLARISTIEVGRTVVYIRSNGKLLKAYVHRAGRSREYMTLVDEKGDDYATIHCSEPVQTIKAKIIEYFRN